MRFVEVPHYPELSVKNIYPLMKKDAKFMSFFPDKYPAGKGPPRDYFFNLLSSLYPEYLREIMAHANEQRMTGEGSMQKT